jgi:PAS domain-containing protein
MERNLFAVPIPAGAGSDDAALPEGIMVIGHDFRITDFNKPFLATRGRKREGVIGHHYYKTSHDCDEPCEKRGQASLLQEVSETGRPRSCCHQHMCTDYGSKAWALSFSHPQKTRKEE